MVVALGRIETRYKILAATAIIITILFLLKALPLILPVLGTGTATFIILGIKAYIGNKIGEKIEENEDTLIKLAEEKL